MDYDRLTLEQVNQLRMLLAIARGVQDNPLGRVVDGELVEGASDEADWPPPMGVRARTRL